MLKVVEVIGVVGNVLVINSRSGIRIGRRITYSSLAGVLVGVGSDVHTTAETDPDDPRNIPVLLAFE